MSVGSDGLLKLWNVRKGECTNTWEAHDDKVLA
jgi:WD40 repeat protein